MDTHKLNIHMKSVHEKDKASPSSKVKSFKCDQCEKSFCNERSVLRHKILHSDNNPFVCDECKKPFQSIHDLRRHKLICAKRVKQGSA